jgi:arabinofuranosyltransferase
LNTEARTSEPTPNGLTAGARVALAGTVVIALLHAASFLGAGPIDDDFITFRYARNLVEGHGLVFNTGEHFEGFTVPLWVFLIAAGLKLAIDPVTTSHVLSIAAAGLAAFAVGRTWQRRYPGSRWPVPALFVALSPALAWHAVAGLGTTLFAALLALWFDLHDRAVRADRPSSGAAWCLAGACLLRQEAALFVPIYLACEWRRKPSASLLLPLLSLLGWSLFRWFYYGRLVPITYSVKKLELLTDLRLGTSYFVAATWTTGVGLFLLASLLAPREAGTRTAAVRAARWGVWLSALYVVYVGGDFVALGRFFIPTLPLFTFLGCAAVRDRLCAAGSSGAPRSGILVGLTLAGIAASQWTQLERPQLFGEQNFFEQRWARIGRHFAGTVAADTSVAISPIGAFGWTSGLPIVDILGLTNDALLDRAPDLAVSMKGHQRFDGGWVLEQRPHFIILANGVRQPDTGQLVINPWERDLYLDARFQRDYVHMRAPIPGDGPLDVFRRRDVPPLPGSVKNL